MLKTWLHFTRIPNLLIIILSLILSRYALVFPLLPNEVADFLLSDRDFILLILSTVLIAFGGYIINNIQDVEIDKINKPGVNAFENLISPKSGRILYYAINLLALIPAYWVAHQLQRPALLSIQLASIAGLYLYALKYKAKGLIGNAIVSFLSGLILLLVPIYELLAIPAENFVLDFQTPIIKFSLWYAAIAFLISMNREIVKGLEDINGDLNFDLKTLAIKMGKTETSWLSLFFAVFNSVVIYLFTQQLSTDYSGPFYTLIAATLFCLLSGVLAILSLRKNWYSHSQLALKLAMLCGILSMLEIPFQYA